MPTDEQRAFWAEIRANPHDDTPRLVYADWLQENGDENRAAFIRVQCALAKLPSDRRRKRKERATLEPQEKELLATNRQRWIAPFRKVLKGMRAFLDADDKWLDRVPFSRGFLPIHSLELAGAHRLAAAGDDCEPPGEVSVSDVRPAGSPIRSLAVIADWRGAGCITGISLCGQFCTLADDAVAVTVASTTLRNLTSLGFYAGAVTDAGVAMIAGWPGAAKLEYLNLHDNPITNAGAQALVNSPYLGQLRWFDLSGTQIDKDGWRKLRERFGKIMG